MDMYSTLPARPGIKLSQHRIWSFLLVGLLVGCQAPPTETYSEVRVAGAMRDVMWKGELAGVIRLDSLQGSAGMYGLGPLSFLRGEVLLMDGTTYVSRVGPDSGMVVERVSNVSAPFFVYARVKEWETSPLPDSVRSLGELEQYIDALTRGAKRPFVFKLSGQVRSASIHVQNLPPGSTVSSPEEAHRGQVNYSLQNEEVAIVGFFSTEHQGIFTHHDSWLHLHLLSRDEQWMGHLDAAELGEMVLSLPKR